MIESYLTVAELAEALKINQQTIRNWIDRGELRAVRVGPRRVRIRQSDVDTFLSRAAMPQRESTEETPSTPEDRPVRDLEAPLGSDLAQASAALNSPDRAELVAALTSLADSARSLAAALAAPQELD